LLGPSRAQAVVFIGFAVGVPLSVHLATPRIALASGTAFLVSQLLDVAVFHRLRHHSWYIAPMASNSLAAVIDTVVFMSIAFAGTDLPFITWGMGEIIVKLGVATISLVPFRWLSLRSQARRHPQT